VSHSKPPEEPFLPFGTSAMGGAYEPDSISSGAGGRSLSQPDSRSRPHSRSPASTHDHLGSASEHEASELARKRRKRVGPPSHLPVYYVRKDISGCICCRRRKKKVRLSMFLEARSGLTHFCAVPSAGVKIQHRTVSIAGS
jgi:hypothetical protein